LPERRHDRGVPRGATARMQDGSVLGRHIRGVEDVFDAHRDPVQGAEGLALLACSIRPARLLQDVRRVQKSPGFDLRIHRRGAGEAGSHEFLGGDASVADGSSRVKRAQSIQCPHGHLV
jgi:hypothetical protein